MSGTFKDFMVGENQFKQKKQRINWYNLATQEADNRFNKRYEDLTPQELKELISVLAGTLPYW